MTAPNEPLGKPTGAQAAEQGNLPDDDPDVVDGMAKLELLRQMEDIERLGE